MSLMWNNFALFKKLRVQSSVNHSKRNMWAYLNIIFNLVDENRIKEVGPDRACAEWLLRNGAAVSFNGESPTKDYNMLASLPTGMRLKLTDIDASEASITHHGFRHLIDCNEVRSIRIHKCWYVTNKAIGQLDYVKNTLSKLHISSCDEVTDAGVKSLVNLQNLSQLSLADLRVKDWKSCEEILRKGLKTGCDIQINPS